MVDATNGDQVKQLLYGPHEIRLSDDEDTTALAERLSHATNGAVVEVTDARGHLWQLIVSDGVPVAIHTKDRPPKPRAVAPRRLH